MPWVITGLRDGEPPTSYRWVRGNSRPWMDDGYQPQAGEVVVSENPEGKVWDDAAGGLRARSATEQNALAVAALAAAKEQRESQLRDAAEFWYVENIRSFEGTVVAAKYGRTGAAGLNAEEQAVMNDLTSNYSHLKGLIQQVRNATTVAEVEAVEW